MATENGGKAGLFTQMWHTMVVCCIGIKWQFKEFFSRVKKLDLTSTLYRKGDVVVITGGARGIGYDVIKILLKCDMHVIMGCRQVADGEMAGKKIRSQGILTGILKIFKLDLMSLESVREFADQIIATSLPVGILINNSGIMFAPYKLSLDGYESHFQINYLGHFYLTHMLLPVLIKSGTAQKYSRIVNVSSCVHYGGHIDFNDLDLQKHYSPKLAYMNTKQMQVISTVDMNEKFRKAGLYVRAYSNHPGVIKTDLYQHMYISKCSWMMKIWLLTSEQGAQTIVYNALSPEIEKSDEVYYANSVSTRPNPKVFDPIIQKALWDASYKRLKISEFNFHTTAEENDVKKNNQTTDKKNENIDDDVFLVQMPN